MPKYLGIDYGLQRVGLAITDPEGKIAFPLRTLHLAHYPRRSALLDDIALTARKEGAMEIVIGLPLFYNGGENLMCRQIRNMSHRLKRRLDAPIHFMPEALSSEEALADLKESGMKRNKFRDVLDQQAACRILQSFLAQQGISP